MSEFNPEFKNLQLYGNSHIAVLFTSWNAAYINLLKEGVEKILNQFSNITYEKIEVPGAVELTFAANTVKEKYDAIICLGIVIKGDTPHFEYVCDSVTQGITYLNATQNTPIIFGVLTVLNEEQIKERLGGKHGHKGEEAAWTALKMIEFKQKN